jgi:hypothetical protein
MSPPPSGDNIITRNSDYVLDRAGDFVQKAALPAAWNTVFFDNFSTVPQSTSATGCPTWTGNNGATVTQQQYYSSNTGTATATRCWQSDTGGTPSSSTGPNGGVVDTSGYAANGNVNSSSSYRYMYTETSSPNYPTVSLAFRYYKSNMGGSGTQSRYKFWYHMYGATMGGLTAYAAVYNSSFNQASRAQVISISGQQQTSATQAYLERSVTVTYSTTYGVGISFYYVSGTSFTGDLAIDSLLVEAFY